MLKFGNKKNYIRSTKLNPITDYDLDKVQNANVSLIKFLNLQMSLADAHNVCS